MEDTHSSQYEYLAPPVEPDPDQPSAYSLIGGGRPERLVRRRTTTLPAAEPAAGGVAGRCDGGTVHAAGSPRERGTESPAVSATERQADRAPALRGEGGGGAGGGGAGGELAGEEGELSHEGLPSPRGRAADEDLETVMA